MSRCLLVPLVTVSHTPDIQLVALDLDGTLLTSRKTISARAHRALQAVRKRGIHIIFATARPPRSVRTYYQHLRLKTPQINYNGALIWDEAAGKIIEHRPLASAAARRVIDFARKQHPEVLVSVEILDKWYTDHYADMPEYATETAKHFTPDFVGPLDAFLTVPITKLMLLGDPKWIEKLEKTIPAKFGKAIGHTRSDPHILQILHPGVDKGGALAKVAAHLGVAAENVLAMGDAPNDADMLKFAGLAVVPQNAWPRIIPLADHIVPSNDNDGAAIALETLVLKRPAA